MEPRVEIVRWNGWHNQDVVLSSTLIYKCVDKNKEEESIVGVYKNIGLKYYVAFISKMDKRSQSKNL